MKRDEHLHVLHTAPQARLDRVGIPAEDVHDEGPAQAGEDGPGPGLDLRACGGGEEGMCQGGRGAGCGEGGGGGAGAGSVGLDGEFGEGEHDAGEDVDDDLE